MVFFSFVFIWNLQSMSRRNKNMCYKQFHVYRLREETIQWSYFLINIIIACARANWDFFSFRNLLFFFCFSRLYERSNFPSGLRKRPVNYLKRSQKNQLRIRRTLASALIGFPLRGILRARFKRRSLWKRINRYKNVSFL